MSRTIPEEAQIWVDSGEFAVIATVEPSSQPHLSVVWVLREGDDLLIATVVGRRNHTNLVNNPRATILVYPRSDPYKYLEVRGTVTLSEEGGRELIDDLNEKYVGERPYPNDTDGQVRIKVRLTPEKVVIRH